MSVTARFHPGECAVQERAGQSALAHAKGQIISNVIIPAAWQFLAEQSMTVLGSWDGQRSPWPTLILGRPGFVSTRDGTQLRIDLANTSADRDDPLWRNVRRNGVLSAIVIDLATRRRLRVNGYVDVDSIASFFDAPFELKVAQSYPNCPKYIQRRDVTIPNSIVPALAIGQSDRLSAAQTALIEAADTLFVATHGGEYGCDISHRGGQPGFVQVESPTRLRIPDYAGNSFFNTLGNIHVSGTAGVLFLDFNEGRMLQISGDAHIDWSAEKHGQRSWTVALSTLRESLLPAWRWHYREASPFNPAPI